MGESDASSHDVGIISVLRDVLEELGASDSQVLAEIVWLHLDHPLWGGRQRTTKAGLRCGLRVPVRLGQRCRCSGCRRSPPRSWT
jgi:hypothetical protein